MKKMVIIKTGDTHPTLAAQAGDFEAWVIAGLALDPEKISVVDVGRGHDLPHRDTLAGVVITGSHAMVTDEQEWSLRTAAWLPEVVAQQIPVLGICYGHQLLAQALGGRVGGNPRGLEFGTVAVELHAAGEVDSLFGGMANPLKVHVCHSQTVLTLPPGAQLLAHSANDPHQAFRAGEWAWGLQFHPEFHARAMEFYIRHYRGALAEQGVDVDRLLADTCETPFGDQILNRFGELARYGDG